LTASACSAPDRAVRYRELADRTLDRGTVVLAKAPRSAGQWLTVAEAALHGPTAVAIATNDRAAADLLTEARTAAPGGALVLAAEPDSVPLLADRPPVDGAAAAYVCRGSVCDLPVTTVDALRESLS